MTCERSVSSVSSSMEGSCPSPVRIFEHGGKSSALLLGLGLCMLSLPTSFGEETSNPTGNSRMTLAAPLRISVASHVAQACGSAIPPSVVQQDAEAWLRGVGVTVSNIHNAQLELDVDCVAATPGAQTTSVALYQCLSFSEAVSAPSNSGRATLATTWRRCQSFTCGRAKCEPLARSGLHALMSTFWTDFQERNSQNAQQIRPQQQASVIAASDQPPPAGPGPSAAHDPISQRAMGRILFYSLYIMTCVTLLVYWQFRGHRYRFR